MAVFSGVSGSEIDYEVRILVSETSPKFFAYTMLIKDERIFDSWMVFSRAGQAVYELLMTSSGLDSKHDSRVFS